MRRFILAMILSLTTYQTATAAFIPLSAIGSTAHSRAMDHDLCNKARYKIGFPWINPTAALFMRDCLDALAKLTEERLLIEVWHETQIDAEVICRLYIAKSKSCEADFQLIVEMIDLKECVAEELAPHK